MVKEITAIFIVFPFLAALCCYVFRDITARSFIVLTTGGVLAASALFLIPHIHRWLDHMFSVTPL